MGFFSVPSRKSLDELSEREIVALAIQSEEEDARIYRDFGERLQGDYPASADVYRRMAGEEDDHRRQLLDMFQARFGDHIPLIRREDVRGFIRREPVWMLDTLDPGLLRGRSEAMEAETQQFYLRAAARMTNPMLRKLFGDLAAAEANHEAAAQHFESEIPRDAQDEEAATARRQFLLQVVQPGLAGLMDGSVSTLAPLFAAAFATHASGDAFLVGLAASFGAGISMGFAEALSDDGTLTGRGRPLVRGAVCGLATTLGGLGHTLPFLIPDFRIATSLAVIVVIVELFAIALVRTRYMATPFFRAALQVVLGGLLVFATGILIGSAG